MKAAVIADIRCALGEGAIWDELSGRIYFVDITRGELHFLDPKTGEHKSLSIDSKVGTVVPTKEGAVLVAGKDSFFLVEGENIRKIASVSHGANMRFNDGKCDPQGALWCGSMDMDFAEGKGILYKLSDKLEEKLTGLTISNGIAFSGDEKTMFYIDTPTGRVDAFDFAAGEISNRRPAIINTWGGHFDGMTIDEDDNLYIAVWDGGCVLKINPYSGKLLDKIIVPGASKVTSCAFGGDFSDLYITSSGESDPLVEPNAGALFHIRLNTKGRPCYRFNASY